MAYTTLDNDILNRFGPPSKAIPFSPLEVPDFVREQFMQSEQSPQPNRMDQVFDRFMNDNLRVPMNVQALAGIDPRVAQQFIAEQGGLQRSGQQYGTSPAEREQRNRLLAATQLGGQHLAAQAGMADATARQNVGMKAADANFLGNFHGNVSSRMESEADRAAADQRLKSEYDFLTKRDATQFEREDKRHQEARGDTRRAGMFGAVQSGAQAEMARIDSAEKMAMQQIQESANRGYMTEEDATAKVLDMQAQFESARQQVRSQLNQSNMAYQSGGDITPLNPLGQLPRYQPATGQYEKAAFQKLLENKLAEAEAGWSMAGGLPHKLSRQQAFLSSLPDDIPDQALVRDFIQKKFGREEPQSGVQTAIRNLSLAAPTMGASLLPGVTDEIAEFLGFDTERSRQRKAGR